MLLQTIADIKQSCLNAQKLNPEYFRFSFREILSFPQIKNSQIFNNVSFSYANENSFPLNAMRNSLDRCLFSGKVVRDAISIYL